MVSYLMKLRATELANLIFFLSSNSPHAWFPLEFVKFTLSIFKNESIKHKYKRKLNPFWTYYYVLFYFLICTKLSGTDLFRQKDEKILKLTAVNLMNFTKHYLRLMVLNEHHNERRKNEKAYNFYLCNFYLILTVNLLVYRIKITFMLF